MGGGYFILLYMPAFPGDLVTIKACCVDMKNFPLPHSPNGSLGPIMCVSLQDIAHFHPLPHLPSAQRCTEILYVYADMKTL